MKEYRFQALWLFIFIAAGLTGCASNSGQELAGALPARGSAVRYDFSNSGAGGILPVKLGDKIFVPLEPVSKLLSLELEIHENGDFVLNTGKEKIAGKAGSTEVTIDGSKQHLDLPVMRIENQLFVPGQFIMRYMSTRVHYNEKTRELLIQRIE